MKFTIVVENVKPNQKHITTIESETTDLYESLRELTRETKPMGIIVYPSLSYRERVYIYSNQPKKDIKKYWYFEPALPIKKPFKQVLQRLRIPNKKLM